MRKAVLLILLNLFSKLFYVAAKYLSNTVYYDYFLTSSCKKGYFK